MPEETSKITIIADLLKRDPAYKEVIDQLEERLYNRYMVYLADKPRFNSKTQAIPKQYLAHILSSKNTLELNKVAKKYNLSQDQRDTVPAILWKIFWREAEIKNLPQMLNGELGLNNIRVAYQMALDIVPTYMPISDYLGDLGMVMKRWQYELPTETAISYQQSAISQSQTQIQKESPIPNLQPPAFAPTTPITPAVPPIRLATPTSSSVIPAEAGIQRSFAVSQDDKKDESIARVQETMARISGQMAKIQTSPTTPITPSPVIPSSNEESQRFRDSSVASLPQNDDAKTAQDDKRKSDIEPEYLPDTPPTHSANIIDLKNF